MRYSITMKSQNSKTGQIPVSMTSSESCPSTCPLNGSGCYAQSGPMSWAWAKMKQGLSLSELCAKIESIPSGQLWRHNQAGDLPGIDKRLDTKGLDALVAANGESRGYTYTHKPLTRKNEREAVRRANENGFTINLSANNLKHADKLADFNIGPVAVAVPREPSRNPSLTPGGRVVVDCPATYRDDVTCASCKLCAVANRKTIVAFAVHGVGKRKAATALGGTL